MTFDANTNGHGPTDIPAEVRPISGSLPPAIAPPAAPSPKFDGETVRRFLSFIVDPSIGCTELRIFSAGYERNFVVRDSKYSKTLGGWYDDVNLLAVDLARLKDVSGYVTANPVHRDFLSRIDNRIDKHSKATTAANVICLRWMYIDIDSKRIDDISATDAELAAAIARRDQILADHPGMAESSIWGTSGNGSWILVRLPDYPNDDTHNGNGHVGKALAVLSRRYSDPVVHIDVKTKDPSRVMTIPGTRKCKGSDRPERPWRLSTMDCPEDRTPGNIPSFDLAGWVAQQMEAVELDGVAQQMGGAGQVALPAAFPPNRPAFNEFDRDFRLRRAAARIANTPGAISGQGGHDQTFDVACALIKGFDLSIGEARPIFEHWNAKCVPPWSTIELEHKLSEADKKPDDKPRGYLFDKEREDHGRYQPPSYIPTAVLNSVALGGHHAAFDVSGLPAPPPPRPVAQQGQGPANGGYAPSLPSHFPRIDIPAIHAAAAKHVEANQIDLLYRDSDFMASLAIVEHQDPVEYQVIRSNIRRIKNYLNGPFENLYGKHRINPAVLMGNPASPGGSGIPGNPGGPSAANPSAPATPDGLEDNPHQLARNFIAENYRHPDGIALRFWREEFHAWNGSCYRPIPRKEVGAEVARSIESSFYRMFTNAMMFHQSRSSFGGMGGMGGKGGSQPPKPMPVTTRLVGDVTQALSDLALLRVRECGQQPAWIVPDAEWDAADVLPARNVLVHLPSLQGDGPVPRSATRPPTPNYFGSFAVNYDYAANAPTPTNWLAFLGQLWPNDEESVAALQEWMGYLLTPDTSQQKLMMLIGPKRSGKGTIARVIHALIGQENVVNPTLSSLALNFGLAPLIGKPAAIITDARISGRTDTAVVIERLLSISGEDSQTIDRKHRDTITMKLPTRFMLISNELPKMKDTSGALVGRMIFLQLSRSFYGEEDTGLYAKLSEELPGILNWAIEGWKRLRARGHFVQPKSAEELLGTMDDLSSPIKAFLRECMKVAQPGEECVVQTSVAYEKWKAWCQENGLEHSGTNADFGRNLRAVLPNLKKTHKRMGPTRVWMYEGVRLLGDDESNTDEGEAEDMEGVIAGGPEERYTF